MSDPYIGEIRMFGGNFAPVDWAFCDGSSLAISDNEALFTLIGTTYGGDGQNNFNLPDLRGRVPIHQGQAGGTDFAYGQSAGSETVTLTSQNLPSHNHPFNASTAGNGQASPSNAYVTSTGSVPTYLAGAASAAMAGASIGASGNSQPHDNMMPYLAVNFIICIAGIYPSQS